MREYELVCGVQPRYLDYVLDPDRWNSGLLVSKHLYFSDYVLDVKFYSYPKLVLIASVWSPAWVSNAE